MLGRWRYPKLLVLCGRHLDVDINPIEQRAGYLRDIPLDHGRSAVALASWIAKISAGAGIHRRGQHEPRRKRYGYGGTRDRHGTVLERLPHHLQHIPLKFRQFIEEQHAVVTQRHFPRSWHRAATNEPSITDSVMRRTERP